MEPAQLAGSNCGSRSQLAIALCPNLAWMCPPNCLQDDFTWRLHWPHTQPYCSHCYKTGNQHQVWALLFLWNPSLKKGRCLLLFRPHHWLPMLVRNRSACPWSFPLQPGSFSSFFLSLWCSGVASTVTGSKVPHTLDPTRPFFFRRTSSYRSWKLECSFSSPTIPPWPECPFST